MNVNILILSLFIIIIGCSNSNKINNYNEVDMKKELSYEEAQKLALELVSNEFKKKELKNPDTGKVHRVKIDSILLKKENNKWIFQRHPPAGLWYEGSFNLNGSSPKIEVGFSWD